MTTTLIQNLNTSEIALGETFKNKEGRFYIPLKEHLNLQVETTAKYSVSDYQDNKKFKLQLDTSSFDSQLIQLHNRLSELTGKRVNDFYEKFNVNVYKEEYMDIKKGSNIKAIIVCKGGFVMNNLYYPSFTLEKCEVIYEALIVEEQLEFI